MLSVPINEPELRSIDYIRIALSEPTPELREKAIANAKHELVALRLEALSHKLGSKWMSDPQNAEFVQWIARTSSERHEASYAFSQTARQYEERNERKLNVAEHIGKLIWLSIQDNRFEGVQTPEGILKRVSDQAQEYNVSGARDLDTLRGIWKTYRGVVHLGMAIDYCEDNPNQAQNVISVAENFRLNLSHFCPKGTKKPYVPETDQIKFCYSSNTSGPRFLDRGLPYDVS
jgi:fructose-specific component phosphotransferase system IIB-like protein